MASPCIHFARSPQGPYDIERGRRASAPTTLIPERRVDPPPSRCHNRYQLRLYRQADLAKAWTERLWAVDESYGAGRPLAHRLLEAGERGVDVPASCPQAYEQVLARVTTRRLAAKGRTLLRGDDSLDRLRHAGTHHTATAVSVYTTGGGVARPSPFPQCLPSP